MQHLNERPVRPDRVVVLGAAGFVGRAVVRALAARDIPSLPLTRREVNLLDDGAVATLRSILRPADSVVLISAMVPARTPSLVAQNVRMMETVCAVFAEAPVAHAVYVSSDAVYADHANPVTEESCCQPSTLHGVMHATRELMLRAVAHGPLAILRPTLLYGPGDPHNGYGPNRFLRCAARGEPIVLFGEGEEQRDHVYVDDVGHLIALVLLHRSAGVLNVATGSSTSFRAVAEMVARLAPQSVEIRCTPRQSAIVHRHFDVTACVKAFPTFRFTSLAEGLSLASKDT